MAFFGGLVMLIVLLAGTLFTVEAAAAMLVMFG